jgi:hypothetical protein
VSFTVTGIWSSAALAAKLQEQGCKVASLLRLEDGELTDYIDQLSGRRNPIFPEVLFRGTTMIVWCQ